MYSIPDPWKPGPAGRLGGPTVSLNISDFPPPLLRVPKQVTGNLFIQCAALLNGGHTVQDCNHQEQLTPLVALCRLVSNLSVHEKNGVLPVVMLS